MIDDRTLARFGISLEALKSTMGALRHPRYSEMVNERWPTISKAVVDLLESILCSFATSLDDEGSTEGIVEILRESAGYLGHQYVFDGSNKVRNITPAYEEARSKEYYEKFMGVDAVHLELGTFTAFPSERVEQIIVQEELGEFMCLDFDPQYKPDIVGDVTKLPFADESVDRISSNSVFEHIAFPHDAIAESFRVLRPGGVMRITTLFMFPSHGFPDDYLRYTESFLGRISRECGFEKVMTESRFTSGAYYTIHNVLKGTSIRSDLNAAEKAFFEAVHCTILMLLAAVSPFDKKFKNGSAHIYKSVEAIAVKGGKFQRRQRPARSSGSLLERNLDLLACPESRLPLVRKENELTCRDTGKRYPIENGVPIFTPPSERS